MLLCNVLRCSVFIPPHGMTVTDTDCTQMTGIGHTFSGYSSMITSSICLACHGTPNSGVHWHTSIHTNSNWHPILVLHTTCYVIHTRHTPFHTNNNWSHHMLYCSHATHLHSQHQIHFTPNINASHHMLGHSHTIHTLSHQQQLVTPHAILFTRDTPSFTPNPLHTQYQYFTPYAISFTPNTHPFTPTTIHT